MKRLTVHLSNEKKVKVIVTDSQGKDINKEILKNTLSYKVTDELEAQNILGALKGSGKTITKHYLSNIR